MRSKTAPADATGKIKANSSGCVHEEWPARAGLAWQVGYGAFSVSHSNLEQVKRYIKNQKEHHRTMTFEDEFIGLLKKHGIEYDPRFVFD